MALGGLQQQLEEAVQQQSAEIENKIRAFTTEQYQLLEQFRERAHNEHRLLTRYRLMTKLCSRFCSDFLFSNMQVFLSG